MLLGLLSMFGNGEFESTSTFLCDSESAIHLVQNKTIHANTKDIEVRYHHIWEPIKEKRLKIRKIDTELNITVGLTKPLLDDQLRTLTVRSGLQQERTNESRKKG